MPDGVNDVSPALGTSVRLALPVNHHVSAAPAEPLSEYGHCDDAGTKHANGDVHGNRKQEGLDFHLTNRRHECWCRCNELAASTSIWIFIS